MAVKHIAEIDRGHGWEPAVDGSPTRPRWWFSVFGFREDAEAAIHGLPVARVRELQVHDVQGGDPDQAMDVLLDVLDGYIPEPDTGEWDLWRTIVGGCPWMARNVVTGRGFVRGNAAPSIGDWQGSGTDARLLLDGGSGAWVGPDGVEHPA